jgi:hypothetical protein
MGITFKIYHVADKVEAVYRGCNPTCNFCFQCSRSVLNIYKYKSDVSDITVKVQTIAVSVNIKAK